MSGTGIVKSLAKSLPLSLPRGIAKQGGGTPPFILSGLLSDGNQATDYDGTLNISGGVPPYSNPQVVAGSLPAEFILSISGSQLNIHADAPITFSGEISISLTVDDAASQTTPPYPVVFTITESNFIMTENGDFLMTENSKFLVTE